MESNRPEYKRELTDQLEKEVVAFLNYMDGGVTYLGSNIPRILANYNQSVFHINDNFIRVPFPFNKGFDEKTTEETKAKSVPISVEQLCLIKDNPKITSKEISYKTGYTKRSIGLHLKEFKTDGKLKREGPNKGGSWIIIK